MGKLDGAAVSRSASAWDERHVVFYGLRDPVVRRSLVVLLLLVALVLVLVLRGGEHRRKVPATQASLSAAVKEAQRTAGSLYYRGAMVNLNAKTVTVFLSYAPQSVMDSLNAKYPGVYIFRNNALPLALRG
jgi:hypothetical protein